jgi:hypothetical protein
MLREHHHVEDRSQSVPGPEVALGHGIDPVRMVVCEAIIHLTTSSYGPSSGFAEHPC